MSLKTPKTLEGVSSKVFLSLISVAHKSHSGIPLRLPAINITETYVK